jgi:hypothetical protein
VAIIPAAWWATGPVARRNGGEAVDGASESNRKGDSRRNASDSIYAIGVAVFHQLDDEALMGGG